MIEAVDLPDRSLDLIAPQYPKGLALSFYGDRVEGKLDMGKSCVRLKKIDKIPFELLGELCSKITVDEWIDTYEREIKK